MGKPEQGFTQCLHRPHIKGYCWFIREDFTFNSHFLKCGGSHKVKPMSILLQIKPLKNSIKVIDKKRSVMKSHKSEFYRIEEINGILFPRTILQYVDQPLATRIGAYGLAKYINETMPQLTVDWLQTFITVETMLLVKNALDLWKKYFPAESENLDSVANLSLSQPGQVAILNHNLTGVVPEIATYFAIETLETMGFVISTSMTKGAATI